MTETPDFAGICRPLRHSVSQGDSCRADFRKRLKVSVTEFLGTSPKVSSGDKYIVRGTYSLSGDIPVSLGAVMHGTSRGHYVDLAPGTGAFAVWAEVQEVGEGGAQSIGLMVGTTEDRECGDVHTSIRIIG